MGALSRTKKRITLSAVATLGLGALLAAELSQAQQEGGLDEIIVTARKREESILNVPVQETVISHVQIEQQGLLTADELVTQVPGLVMGYGSAGFGQSVTIRGIGIAVESPAVDQDVSLNIDGIQINDGLAYTAGLFDVAQVEVLKGPQALFYGKNSPGGVISLRSNDPGDHFEMMGRVGYETEAIQKHGEAYVSGPVSDTLGLRLAVSYNTEAGFFYNVANPALTAPGFIGGLAPHSDRLAPQQDLILRGTAVWKPTDNLSWRLKVLWDHNRIQDSGGSEYQLSNCPVPPGIVSASGIPFEAGEDCTLNRTMSAPALDPRAFPGIPHGGNPFDNNDQYFVSAEMNYEVTPTLALTSVSGYTQLVNSHLFDGSDESSIPTLADVENLRRRDWTEELRVSSNYDSPLNFMAGAYYQNGFFYDRTNLPVTQAFGPGFPPSLTNGWSTIGISSVSAFGQVRYAILPNLELSAGARFTHEQRTHKTFAIFSVIGGGFYLTPQYLNLAVPKITSNNVSPELNITYHPTQDTTLYASYKEGFKSGSFNTGAGYNTTGQNFGDEKVHGEEAGFKWLLLDNQLSIDLAGYHYLYKDMQVSALLEVPGQAFTFQTINAASAKILGAELSLSYQPEAIAGLRLNTSMNYNHGRFGTFDNAPCWATQTAAQGCNLAPDPVTGLYQAQNLSGKRLVRSPDVTATIGADYKIPLPRNYSLLLGSDVYYSSRFVTTPNLYPAAFQTAYTKLNANISVRSPGDVWEIALKGKNLTDKIIGDDRIVADLVNGLLGFAPTTAVQTTAHAEPGREIWLTVTWHYAP